ncbi:MAG: nicotinate phosphoribosyltransferase [Terriglobales bacterium]
MPDALCHSVLLTDLYELTMGAAYFQCNLHRATASFELFVRNLPQHRGFLLMAGLEQAVDFLEKLHFEPDEIEYLRRHPMFKRVPPEFFDYLADLRFTGEVWAMPEGTPVFGDEPLLRVTAPIVEAQIVETYLLATLTFQTMIATKAARLVEAAQGRDVVDFGTRRAHGPEAGVLAARAAYVGGCVGTSNVEAGVRFGIPTLGTVAHSFIMAYGDEERAFRDFANLFPENVVLLVDTYDTMAAIEKIIRSGLRPRGVRLDSGNLAELSQQVRQRLDAAGLRDTRIFVSGDLDEFAITRLLAQDAPADLFAVGTALVTSKDAPALGGVYKLVEVHEQHAAQARMLPRYTAKFSADKFSYPGSKQVFRFSDGQCYSHDVLACAGESYPEGEPLLEPVMRAGKRLRPAPALPAIREQARDKVCRLHATVRELHSPARYAVQVSEELQKLLEQVRKETIGAS